MATHELGPILAPRSVVVMGIDGEKTNLFHPLTENLRQGYRGHLYLVGKSVPDLEVLSDLEDLPETPELALLTSPSHRIPEQVKQCLARGIRNLVVYSGGFAETGPEGVFAQSKLVAQIKASGGRLVGPNSPGILRTYSGLNATLIPNLSEDSTPSPTQKAGISLVSSSGGLTAMVLGRLTQRQIPVQTAIGLGNCADLSPADWLDFFATDSLTRMVGLILEGGGSGGRHWLDTAVRLSRQKPLIVMRVGTSQAGMAATAAHTGAPPSDVRLEDLLRQAGLTVARDMPEMVTMMEAHWRIGERLPAGRSTVIITNSGGAGALAADYVTEAGLQLPRLEQGALRRLERCVPHHGSVQNPIDVTESFREYASAELVDAALTSQQVNSGLIISIGLDNEGLGEAAEKVQQTTGRPVVLVLENCPRLQELCRRKDLLVAESVGEGVTKLSTLHQRAVQLEETSVAIPPGLRRASRVLQLELGLEGSQLRTSHLMLGTRTFGNRPVQERSLESSPPPATGSSQTVDDEICRKVLKEYGLPLLEEVELRSIPDIEWYAEEQGYPLIVQLRPSGEILRITNPERKLVIVGELEKRREDYQRMVLIEPRPPGDRLFVRGLNHPEYGSLLAFRNYRETLWRLCPASRATLSSTLERLGFKAEPPALDAIERLGGLLVANPRVSRVELDPLVIHPTGATVAGHRLVIV